MRRWRSSRSRSGHGEVAIRDAFPEMPPPILEPLKNFLAKVDNVTAKPIYGTTTINGDKAELEIHADVSAYMYRDSKAPGTAQFKYRATLARHKDRWEITDLTTIP